MEEGINVLSLFDGMSCGQIAMERTKIKVKNYYASEIEEQSITIAQNNYPNTIQIGDVRNIRTKNLPFIDLVIGGSPCQSFSFLGSAKGMSTKDEIEILSLEQYLKLKAENFEFEGESYLFWEYVRVLQGLKEKNPNILFMLENVGMKDKWEHIISKTLGVNPIKICSSLVTPQTRRRLYWTNIGMKSSGLFGYDFSIIQKPKKIKNILKDILQSNVDEKYFLKNGRLDWLTSDSGIKSTKKRFTGIDPKIAGCLTKRGEKSWNCTYVTQNGRLRTLTPIEYERLQTVPDNYTAGVDDSYRYEMLGNGWTVDIISHIFSYIK